MGDKHKAIEYYEKGLLIAKKIGDKRGVSSILCNLGSSYAGLGNKRNAIEQYEKALAIIREIGANVQKA